MLVSPSTALVIALLLCAASLASYLLSQWLTFPSARGVGGFAGMGLATVLLIAAAVVFTLGIGGLITDRVSGREAQMAQPVIGSPPALSPAAQVDADRVEPAAARTGAEASERHSEYGAQSTRYLQPSQESGTYAAVSSSGSAAGHTTMGRGARVAAMDDPTQELWGATRCVLPFHPDPTDPTRWSIDNECDTPVAIVVACAPSAQPCMEFVAGLILPPKAQRAVSPSVDIRNVEEIRLVACEIRTSAAAELIGEPSGIRALDSWIAQFESARMMDDCLIRARGLSAAVNRSGILPLEGRVARMQPRD